MLRDWESERAARVAWVRDYVGGAGVIFGNSGGKDAALVGILCRQAVARVFGVVMPCESARNYAEDRDHALRVAEQYDIRTLEVNLTDTKMTLVAAVYPMFVQCAQNGELEKTSAGEMRMRNAVMNVNPRLRMTTLYTLGQSLGCLVAGTGNRSERVMGYFTKWGDGACDFNPISDLTVTEIYEFLAFLGAPEEIIRKAPSAGLFDGQTDEAEMGITYAEIDAFLLHGEGSLEAVAKIRAAERVTAHKRALPACYPG